MKKRLQPMVYIAWGKSGQCLYVGRSFQGLARPSRNKTILDNQKRITNIELIRCSSPLAAIRKEIELIRKYQPTLNRLLYPGLKRTKTYLLKLDEATMTRWKRMAQLRRLSFAEFIRYRVEEH